MFCLSGFPYKVDKYLNIFNLRQSVLKSEWDNYYVLFYVSAAQIPEYLLSFTAPKSAIIETTCNISTSSAFAFLLSQKHWTNIDVFCSSASTVKYM